jgi:hypothetical protein
MSNSISGIPSAQQSGLVGLRRSWRQMDRTAQEIASAPVARTQPGRSYGRSATDTTQALISLKRGAHSGAANVKSLQASQDMIGTLLNIRA